MSKRIDSKRILHLFSMEPQRQLTLRGVMRLQKLPGRDRGPLEMLLRHLVDDGQLKLIKGRRYALNVASEELTGILSVHRDGYGFVTPEGESGRERDVFLPARQLRAAMHGDRVVVQVVRSQRDGRREGRLLRVEQRAQSQVVGIFRDLGRQILVVPEDPRLGQALKVPWGEQFEAQDGELVVAQIETYASRGQEPLARIVEVLGDPADPWVEVRAQARRFNFPDEFIPEILAAAEKVPAEVCSQDLSGRIDLRELPLVTIDGADAKDFDDAVYATREDEGNIRAWVAIADVDHYVTAGSPLDRDAWQRGNSIYFPGICVPMLPEALSNGICSLNPEVERLVMTAEMLFDPQGERLEAKIYPAVMRSRARLTYSEVQQSLDAESLVAVEVQTSLEALADLARSLTTMRTVRGSLELDLPEAKVLLDELGQAHAIVRGERLFAHRLIEELMLAANEAVAAYLTARELPMIYRVHDPPDATSLEPLKQILRGLEAAETLPEELTPKDLQHVLHRFHDTPQAEIVSHVILRCLQQARYDTTNSGHFGLASPCYSHFTSPIRRYPDLIVHRLLKRQLQGEQGYDPDWLERTAQQCSLTERRAMEAERDLVALKGCQVMQQHLGEVFTGRVSSLARFGLFVELDEVFVEGLLPLSSLEGDSYVFDELRICLVGTHSGREIHIGEELRVQVAAVRNERREIDFVPEGFSGNLSQRDTRGQDKGSRRRSGRRK